MPSSEDFVMNLDTSLIYNLNPGKAVEVFQKIGGEYEIKVVMIEKGLPLILGQ